MVNDESLSQKIICFKLNNRIHLQKTEIRPQKAFSLRKTCMLNHDHYAKRAYASSLKIGIYLHKTEIETSEIKLLCNTCMLNHESLQQGSICFKLSNRIHFAQNRNRDLRKYFHCGIHVIIPRDHMP